jgi:hypothetical protein
MPAVRRAADLACWYVICFLSSSVPLTSGEIDMTTVQDAPHAATPHEDFDRLHHIVRGEYLEIPGLRLTKRQAQRLWALDTETCDELLATLEGVRFLRRTRGGDYILAYPY